MLILTNKYRIVNNEVFNENNENHSTIRKYPVVTMNKLTDKQFTESSIYRE